MEKEIKILSTLGPASMSRSLVEKMDASGVDIFRVNLSHTKESDFVEVVKSIRGWTKKPICVDSEGAQIRTGKMRGGSLNIAANSIVNLVKGDILGTEAKIPLYPIAPDKILQPGDLLYIDFDSVIVQVIKMEREEILARVISPGEIGSNKGVALDRQIELPAFTAKDLSIFKMAQKLKLDHVALSFAQNKNDVKTLRNLFHHEVFLISKIESKIALGNLQEIAKESDAILIDRGDLSRDVPIQKIGLAQRYIIEAAQKTSTPVYVATNFLESMRNSGRPTRAEINDITSTVLSGASGLVLAAETAIGKHPVESVRMISGIIKETRYYTQNNKNIGSYLSAIDGYSLIEPHGGTLVQNFASDLVKQEIKKAPKISVDYEILSDIAQIGEGVYSPLRGFMNLTELNSVLKNYRLPNGIVWPMPTIFQLHKNNINFKKGWVGITSKTDGRLYAAINVSGIERVDLKKTARVWFGTDDINHPGVARFLKRGDYIVSGEVFIIERPVFNLGSYVLTPKQTRRIFADFNWRTIVGFHTRNVIHRGHEFIQKKALNMVDADALFVSPVVGSKKETDFSAQAIVRSYEIMLQGNFYTPYPMVLGAFDTYSRYSGPREAVFTALCRKNFGCSHFVVGRDHTGVGSYYAPDASQKLFKKLGDIGIKLLMFNAACFCSVCRETTDNCEHPEGKKMSLSGTEARKHLINNKRIPEYLMRKEVAGMLHKWHKTSPHTLFEKKK